jgi:hypothetical protein
MGIDRGVLKTLDSGITGLRLCQIVDFIKTGDQNEKFMVQERFTF